MRKTQSVDALLSPLIISVFRLNGALITAGDRLVADLGLTSARWQVLGVIANAPAPLTIASIARTIGLTRQSVRIVTTALIASELVQFKPNPHHRRAQLVMLTAQGQEAERAAKSRQRPWAKSLGKGISPEQIDEAVDVLQTLLERLEQQSGTYKDDR